MSTKLLEACSSREIEIFDFQVHEIGGIFCFICSIFVFVFCYSLVCDILTNKDALILEN